MRKQTFQNDTLKDLLKDKNEYVKKGRELSNEIEELEEERNKAGMKVQKLKDKVMPIMEDEIEPELNLGEFEDIESVEINDDGEVVINIVDQVERFKQRYKQQQKDDDEEDDEQS
jgi:recombinational DNA repair ATPase RecF